MLIVPEEPDCPTIKAQVVKVFDGDGFLAQVHLPDRGMDAELSVRCGFIDAPELDQPGGPEAREFLLQIIGEREVELVILTKMDTGRIVDRHGRVVAVPYLHQTDRVPAHQVSVPSTRSFLRNVELELVLNGWAWVLERYCPEQTYFDALADARRHRRGIWSRDDNQHPWTFKTKRYQAGRKAAAPSLQPSLFEEASERLPCPVPGCAGRLVARNGRHGPFIGCSAFPKCRHSQPA